MAVAAYEALLSLIDVLDRILDPSMHRLHLDRKQIEAFRGQVSFLQDFLELHHSQRISEEIILEDLMRQIFNVANEAEDIIDFHVVDQIRKEFPDHRGVVALFCKNIERVMEKIDSMQRKLMMVKEIMAVEQQQPRVRLPAVSTVPPSSSRGKNTMLGFDEQLVRLMDVLAATGLKSDLQILPIVGMGGIGKTTLARSVFDHPYIVHHYDVRIWVTISQEYSVREILLDLLRELGDQKNKESGENLAKLGLQLYKSLFDRRYLIVMDDVWSTKVWEDLHMFFPDNKNGSQIMVTTRLSNVAASFGSNNPFLMDFLDKDQSWNLFCNKAFGEESCLPELEKIGKSIAQNCKGLPLAIVAIGGLLSKSNMTREYWEFVAENVNSLANSEDDDHCLKVLSLSYTHLPIHLKPCLLYMSVFREDDKIRVSELIRLWVAEGFIKPIKDKTLEEVAQGYLKDLTKRNLILIHKWTRRERMKVCGIHDLLKDLCIRESRKEHFYFVPKVQRVNVGCGKCFLCCREASKRIYLPQAVVASQPTSLVGCLLCDDCRIKVQFNRIIFVKAIDAVEDILHPTKLRYLETRGGFKFVANLNLLWNLHTLDINLNGQVLPSEIWEMPQLRHVLVNDALLPDPPTQVDRKDSTIILKNLQTLYSIRNFTWSKDAIERLPNLKTLGIYYSNNSGREWSYYSLHILGCLNKLESLDLEAKSLLTLENTAFPLSLKKLTLRHCKIPWEEMTIIGSLPNLEVLKLYRNAFTGPEWNPIEGEFVWLKLLFIQKSNLKSWGVEKIHFPKLEYLGLRFMKYLEEIPSGIGETLRSIRMNDCLDSAVNSAKKILEEQHSFGNEDFQLYVDYKLVLPSSG